MSEESTPSRYLVLFGFLLLPLLVIAAITFLIPSQTSTAENSEFVTWIKYPLLLLAIGDCAFPWLLQKQLSARSSEERTTLLGYIFTISGIGYGLIFFLMGMPRSDLYLFAAISLAGTLAWGMARIRKSEEPF